VVKMPVVILSHRANPATAGEALDVTVKVAGGSTEPTGKLELKDGQHSAGRSDPQQRRSVVR